MSAQYPNESSEPQINHTAIEAKVFETAQEVFEEVGVTKEQFVREATFESLGLDSLDQVELVMHLEDEFKIEIPDEKVKTFKNVGDVIKFISAELASVI